MIQVVRNKGNIWKDIKDYEGLYQIDKFGRVLSLPKEKKGKKYCTYTTKKRVLKPTTSDRGYNRVSLLNKEGFLKVFGVHQLVAIIFYGHKPCGMKLVINHKDNNKINNHILNIEIITQRQNGNKKHLKHSSIYTGVCWYKPYKKWQATITIKGKLKHLGFFTDEVAAALAYQGELRKIKN